MEGAVDDAEATRESVSKYYGQVLTKSPAL